MDETEKQIEALLFVSGEGMNIHSLTAHIKKNDQEIEAALAELKEHLRAHHALDLLENNGKVGIVTAPSVSKLVEDLAKEELAGELTRAALETLAVIAYKGPLKKSEIDYIRGVNSSFMLRNLLIRGLVERTRDAKDSRSFIYRASDDFLKYLGLTSLADLPEYGAFAEKLDAFITGSQESPEHEKE